MVQLKEEKHYSMSGAAVYLTIYLTVYLSICLPVYPSICLSIYGTISMGDGVDCSKSFNLFLGRRSKGADR